MPHATAASGGGGGDTWPGPELGSEFISGHVYKEVDVLYIVDIGIDI